uniref:Uncharacterized protein n=1 Tax=Corethron hystrix TaxID=216773 RepID=A0A7S1B963_9STRA|mmetsp:Transcript_17964/g.40814  ORF Transcript_17964/g.40814 Transcript_17964/m.40814 type:complete len:333 (+) Transcript_17964:92-1090(+)
MDPQITVKNNNEVIFPKSNHGYPTISALLGGFFGFCGVDVFDSESEIGSRYRRQKSDESIISADSTSIISDLGKEFKIKCRFPDESSYGSTSSDQDQLISPTSSQSKSLDDFKNLIREADIKFSDRIKHTRNIADGDRGYEKYLLLNELQVQQKVINEITARIETLGGVERFRDNEMTDDFIIRYLDEKRIDQPFKAASLQYDDRQSPQASNLMKIANFSLWFEWHHSIPASMNVIAYAFIHMSAFNVFTSLYWEPFPNSISGNMMMVLFSLFVLQVCGSLFKFKFLGDNRFAGYKVRIFLIIEELFMPIYSFSNFSHILFPKIKRLITATE